MQIFSDEETLASSRVLKARYWTTNGISVHLVFFEKEKRLNIRENDKQNQNQNPNN